MTTNDSLIEKLDALAPRDREIEVKRIENYWLKLDSWSISEAALLLLGIDPDYIDIYIDDREIGDLYNNILVVAFNCDGKSLSTQRNYIDPYKQAHYSRDKKVNPREFTQWAKTKGFYVSSLLDNFLAQDMTQLEATTGDSNNTSNHLLKNITELRVEAIFYAAKETFDNPMKIPSGGKSQLKRDLCNQKPNLFTISTFDAAWKKARKAELIKMDNIGQYLHGK